MVDQKTLLRRAAVRLWFVFSAAAAVGFVLMLIADGDNPLRSDDPYIVGWAFGIVAASFAVVYAGFKHAGDRLGKPHVGNAGLAIALAVWCLFLLGWSRLAREGGDLLFYGAGVSFVVGICAYVLCRLPIPRAILAIVCGAGVLFIVMYGVVCIRMSLRTWP